MTGIARGLIVLGNLLKMDTPIIASHLSEVVLGLFETSSQLRETPPFTRVCTFISESIYCISSHPQQSQEVEKTIENNYKEWSSYPETTSKQREHSVELFASLFAGSPKLQLDLINFSRKDPIACVRVASVKALSRWVELALQSLLETEQESEQKQSLELIRPLIRVCNVMVRDAERDATVSVRVAGLELACILVKHATTVSLFTKRGNRY